jgi:hypothetical protein
VFNAAAWLKVGLRGMAQNFMNTFNEIITEELPQDRRTFGALNITVTL